MELQKLADMIHMAGDRGREKNDNGIEKLEAAKQIASENGFVIVVGHSDDGAMFYGSIYDQFDCYDGGTALVDSEGLLPCRDNIDDDEELESYFARKNSTSAIKAIWGQEGYSWTYETEIPHVTFDLLEDYDEEDKFCRGIIFSIKDLK